MSHYSWSRKASCYQHWCLSIFDINYLYLIFEIMKFFSKAFAFSAHMMLRLFFRCSIIVISYYEGISISQSINIVHLCQMTTFSPVTKSLIFVSITIETPSFYFTFAWRKLSRIFDVRIRIDQIRWVILAKNLEHFSFLRLSNILRDILLKITSINV